MQLQLIAAILPWFHAYDHQNYSRHLKYCLCTQQKLEETHPKIYQEFKSGNFSVRSTPGKFNKVASKQVIEQTINKEQKGSGGIVGFSTSERTAPRWIVSSHIVSRIMNDFKTFIGIEDFIEGCSKDLLPSRIDLDERRVAKCYGLINS